jgi:hypothetical protein
MVIDCHAHVFQDWSDPCGHASREVHRKYIQKVQTRTLADVYRARDGARVGGGVLFREGENGWSGLKDVNFRVGNYGRLDFTIDGEDYWSQYMPVGMQRIVAPPELMLAQMAYAGVDHAVLQAGWGYGAMNDYNAFAQSQYPSKFTALLTVDEPRAWTDEALREFDRVHRQLDLQGVYFALDAFARYDFDITFDDSRMHAFWSKVDAVGLPVFFEATSIPDYTTASYVRSMVRLHALMRRYRNIRWVLVMGPPVAAFGQSGRWEFPDQVLAAYRHESLLVEVMFPITWGGVWDYPYSEAQRLIADLRDIVGSDMPNVERFCTYRQSVDYVRRYCSFLSAAEKDLILGGTMDGLLRVSERVHAAAAAGHPPVSAPGAVR